MGGGVMRLLFDGKLLADEVRFEVHLVPERRVFLRADPRQGARLLLFASMAEAYHIARQDVNHVHAARVVDDAGVVVMDLDVVVVEYLLESDLEQAALDVVSVRLPS